MQFFIDIIRMVDYYMVDYKAHLRSCVRCASGCLKFQIGVAAAR